MDKLKSDINLDHGRNLSFWIVITFGIMFAGIATSDHRITLITFLVGMVMLIGLVARFRQTRL